MAESSALAFGRYLRSLRERRGLSLLKVCEISAHAPESLDKGTLSRLERGRQSPSIFKLGPLSRMYEIAPEALIERMELDREIDRLGKPATAGKSYEELHRLGATALLRSNLKWEAYAYFRDAVPLASEERRIQAWSNLVTAIRSLGKNALALHELREIELSLEGDAAQRAILHERMSNCHCSLGNMRQAEEYAESAIAQALAQGDPRTLAFACAARAQTAFEQEQWSLAADSFNRSLSAYRESEGRTCLLQPVPAFESHTLLMLAECAMHLGSVARARRLVLVAKRMSQELQSPMALAYSELLLGRIDERDGAREQAEERFRRAASLAAKTDNRRLAFSAELELFRQAQKAGDLARARASRRRLDRLAPWVPPHILALREFKQLIGRDRERSRTAAEGGVDEQNQEIAVPRARVRAGNRVSARVARARTRGARIDTDPT